MKKFIINTQWGTQEKVYPTIHAYTTNGRLAVRLMTDDDGFPESWSMLTVNIDEDITNKNCSFIDTNNNGEQIIRDIIAAKLGKPTGRYGRSGFCVYPEFEFDMKALEDFNK